MPPALSLGNQSWILVGAGCVMISVCCDCRLLGGLILLLSFFGIAKILGTGSVVIFLKSWKYLGEPLVACACPGGSSGDPGSIFNGLGMTF